MFGARRERHMRTRIRERRRRREPDATPRTRYERALAVETERGGGVELDCHVSPKSVEAQRCDRTSPLQPSLRYAMRVSQPRVSLPPPALEKETSRFRQ